MSTPEIQAFLFDDDNESKFFSHGLTPRRVQQILSNQHLVVPNRSGRAGEYLIIGVDDGGANITVPIQPTHDRTVWRPVTAWPSKRGERTRLRNATGLS